MPEVTVAEGIVGAQGQRKNDVEADRLAARCFRVKGRTGETDRLGFANRNRHISQF
jgi:hypothetical protein